MHSGYEDPSWTAPRDGHDWQDSDVLLTTAWLSALADSRTWSRRLEAVQSHFIAAKAQWAQGIAAPLYDTRDLAAWYIFQANAYATDRQNWVPDEAVRMVPAFTRIGKELPMLLSIPGAVERAARLMNAERAQPDGGIFELLVALAYRRNGWTGVIFAPERPGISRTPDLLVSRPRRRWAVECKRMERSRYQTEEKAHGEALARPVHELSLAEGQSIVMRVAFEAELADLPDDYLVRRAAAFLADSTECAWEDDGGTGYVRHVDWRLARKVLEVDDVYFGSSRMIELLVGRYDHEFDHSMSAKWRPAPERPLWASAVYQASVVSWRSCSLAALRKKARHFRSVIAKANRQLPGDRPGVIHVGVESWSGNNVDSFRHLLNSFELRDFDPRSSRLRWVYGNYIAPEVTTRSDERWAVEETMVPYRIGRRSAAEPLPHHMLLSPEKESRHGVHWDDPG